MVAPCFVGYDRNDNKLIKGKIMNIIEALKDLSKDVCLKSENKIMYWNYCIESHYEKWFVCDNKKHLTLLITDDENAALEELLKKK